MRTKLNLLSFLQALQFGDEGGGGGDVQVDASPSTESTTDNAVPSTALAESDSESQSSVTDSEQQGATENDPLKDVPTLEELQEQANQKVPHAQALAQLRPAYEQSKEQLKQFENFKPFVEKQVDPTVALKNHELALLIHSPVENSTDPNDFTSRPFLVAVDQQSPGTVDQIYKDIATFPVERNGVTDTVIRHQVREWGLNPDNIQLYRDLESGKLNIASGIVRPEDLQGIDQKYHGAFKALSTAQREDVLAQKQTNDKGELVYPAAVYDYLQDKAEALEARQFREQIENEKKAQEQASQQKLEQEIATESDEAISLATQEIYTSIKQSLASQIKISSDELVNEFHLAGVMSNLYTLLDPAGRKLILEPLLQKAGVSLDSTIAGVQVPFDQTVNRFAERLSAAKRFEKFGDTMRARQAMSEATQARQLLTAKLNQVALKLAQPTLNSAAQTNGNGNSGATARTIPNGNGVSQMGSQNPYEANPHPFGSPEYLAFNKRLDRELGSASAFTN